MYGYLWETQIGGYEPPLRRGWDIRWQHGFHDEHVRDGDQFSNALRYVRQNALNHGLVSMAADWPWSSIAFPHLLDELPDHLSW